MNNFTEENLLEYTNDVYAELARLGYGYEESEENDEWIADEFIDQVEPEVAAWELFNVLLDQRDEIKPYIGR